MKHILLVILLFVCFTSLGQISVINTGKPREMWNRLGGLSAFEVEKAPRAFVSYSTYDSTAQYWVDSANKAYAHFWVHNGLTRQPIYFKREVDSAIASVGGGFPFQKSDSNTYGNAVTLSYYWDNMAGGGTDTVSLSNRINAKLDSSRKVQNLNSPNALDVPSTAAVNGAIAASIAAIPLASPSVNGHMDSNNYYLNMQDASTGCYVDSGLTIDAGNTTYSINDVKGWIVNNTGTDVAVPSVSKIHYTGSTGNAPILAGDATYVLITPSLTVVQQGTMPTPKQRRENIYIGKVVHPNHTVISAVNNNPDYAFSAMSALRDLWTPIRLINENIVPSANGANLNINLSAGYLWGNGINFITDQEQPNTVTYAGATAATFQYRTQAGTGTFTNTTTIDPANYDNGGTVTPVGSAARATNQRIYLFPTGQIRIQYGQEWYASLNLAIAGLDSEPFIVNPNNTITRQSIIKPQIVYSLIRFNSREKITYRERPHNRL